jgi:hypothetical protein
VALPFSSQGRRAGELVDLYFGIQRKGQCGALTSRLRVSIINTTINRMIQGDAIGILVAMIRNQLVVD